MKFKQLELITLQLQRENKKLQEDNRTLKEENAYLKFELEQLKDKIYKKKGKPDNPAPPAEGFPANKRGALFGHLGWFRKKPKHIDEIVKVELQACPICGSSDLTECRKPKTHIQQDIIFPSLKVTCYEKHIYYCKSCKKTVYGQAKDELSNSYIGPVAKTVAVWLKYHIKVSDRDIKSIFQSMFGLKITPSAIAGFRGQLAKRLNYAYEALLGKLKQSKSVHIDETGWRINGENHWLWNFSNHKISVSHIDKSRGQKVPEKILGEKYNGILISDFLSAYNHIKARAKQRCLIHLLRDLKKVKDCLWDDQQVQRFAGRLMNLIGYAVELSEERDKGIISLGYLQKRRDYLVRSLEDLNFQNPQHKILQRFVKRLNRHKEEIFTFLYYPGIAYHNNQAERQIRPNVLLRKITFGNRSEEGAKNHNVLMSIIQTAKLNHLNPLDALTKLLLTDDKTKAFTGLAPP